MSVVVSDEQHHPLDADRLRALAGHILADRGAPAGMELSILCVEPAVIARLNARHLGVDDATDVLAFPIDPPGDDPGGPPRLLGDVVVCPEVAAEQAAARERPLQDELDLLVVHGILHLLGHDHAEPAERDAMFALTDRLLTGFHGAAG
ncbi:MAG: rRNA maturation RNase YbeY [Actinomycetota bacterium]|nr:rRNA maturation RNase YbeY [Actinomycetota bacterium]